MDLMTVVVSDPGDEPVDPEVDEGELDEGEVDVPELTEIDQPELALTGGDPELDPPPPSNLAGPAEPIEYTWDWGDGNVEQGDALAWHTYDTYGEYTITVTDSEGLTGTFKLRALPIWDKSIWDRDLWAD